MSRLVNIEDDLLPSQKFLKNNGLESITNNIVLDFLDVASSIFIEDVKNKANDAGDARNLNVTIPVTNVDIWYNQKKYIEKIVEFLSGDKWNIEFTNVPSKISNLCRQVPLFNYNPKYDNVTLLSGGLDSFCGAYVNIKKNENALYCGYKINPYETHGLNNIHDILMSRHQIASKRFKQLKVKKKEHSQRTRSFLFFALACATASMYNIREINLYENGVLSLNPELDSRKTTKTTHPKTIYLINKLLLNLGIDMRINHPFLFKTKGEIINNLSKEFKGFIKFTNTCGIARYNRKVEIKSGHCGFCIPCMLRKISMSAYDNEKYDVQYNASYGATVANCKSSFKDEFKSSNEYFIVFNERIKDGSILNYLNLRAKYYEEKNYLELTNNLLSRFSKEVDKFYSKYPI